MKVIACRNYSRRLTEKKRENSEISGQRCREILSETFGKVHTLQFNFNLIWDFNKFNKFNKLNFL